jgi:hypothetical protein
MVFEQTYGNITTHTSRDDTQIGQLQLGTWRQTNA